MKLHNLRNTKAIGYTTWGCMWEKGKCQENTEYICRNEAGEEIPMQSRVTAYWQDGSVKWTAHTGEIARLGREIEVLPRTEVQADTAEVPCPAEQAAQGIRITETQQDITVDSGLLSVKIPKQGEYLFDHVSQNGKIHAFKGRPVLVLEEPVTVNGYSGRIEKKYSGSIRCVEIEEQGLLQCIIKFEGAHVNAEGEAKMPFIIRMKLAYNCPNLEFTHTFLYDGDEDKDFLKGLGIAFDMPLAGELYNRHIKVTGDHGVFHESMVHLTSWIPRIPVEAYEKQMSGELLFPEGDVLNTINTVMKDTPYWSEYDICQDSVSHFGIRKKLAPENCCYIEALHGNRTRGGLAVGSECGGVLACIRDFWEKYPSGYTVKNMDSDMAECSLWFWSPSAPAMDFRHYANRGYNKVCYEGYDYKGATPYGIACTNECTISFFESRIPGDEELELFTEQVNHPAVYVSTPEFYHEMRAFGYWSLPCEGETEMEQWLEKQLEIAFDFYKNEVNQRNWYGMFNYGDFMHTYDFQRHQWKYDTGGYAWDNTELVPTLWLWLYFLRTGREDVFTLAEKLSRHASEVDVYHMGKYKGLGSRHNVRHWGCPCKEARIAMAAHHRFYYYMTGDRRLEDIFEELKDNEMSFLNKDPLGDFFDKEDMVYPSHARSGPDWSSLCSNWMTQWERFNDVKYREKIMVGINDLKNAPLRLVSGPDFEFDPETCHLRYIGERTTGGCHLQVCMGAPSVWTEMADLLEDEEWKRMIAELGRFYYLPREEQVAESGGLIGDREFSLPFMASAVAAYGAAYLKDDVLAMRTWRILLHTMIHEGNHEGFVITRPANCGNQEALVEIPWVTTNFVAQFCLNTIMVLDFIKDKLPATLEEAEELVKGDNPFFFRKA